MSDWARTRSLGRRDDAEPAVVEVFRAAGATIWKHSGWNEPDLLVGFRGVTHAVEIKTGTRGKLTEGQVKRIQAWQGEPVQICRSAAEAKHLLEVWLTAAAVQAERDRRIAACQNGNLGAN